MVEPALDLVGTGHSQRAQSHQCRLRPHLSGQRRFRRPASRGRTRRISRFRPSAITVDAVRSWLGQQDFTGVTESAQRDYVRAVMP
jgi:hypothetical protein